MSDESNPITASKAWLVEQGWLEDEAANLVSALKANSPERLWELAPKWIEHVGEARKYMALLECVALGIIDVSQDSEDEGWLFKLSDEYRDSPQGQQFAAENGIAL